VRAYDRQRRFLTDQSRSSGAGFAPLLLNSQGDLMSAERTDDLSEPRVSSHLPVSVSVSVSDDGRNGTDATHNDAASSDTGGDKERGSPASEASAIKLRMQGQLPALDDDADVGVQKEHTVTRDGKADLRFTGVLQASAAPESAPEGHWEEYRIYRTDGGKHVFSKVTRNVLEKEEDGHEAEVFDPSPSSVPSQLIRSAREIARARPLTWMDAAIAFFGYEPLAKVLYRKLSVRFEEEIS
jgi:hypothetical protein